jgi:protein disulfide-isomerase-like protein
VCTRSYCMSRWNQTYKIRTCCIAIACVRPSVHPFRFVRFIYSFSKLASLFRYCSSAMGVYLDLSACFRESFASSLKTRFFISRPTDGNDTTMQRFLKNVDFYRKVPADLTKSTTTGACMSICGVFVLLFLFLSELSSFMTVSDRFEIAMNDDSVLDTALQININISMHHLPCKFASVDITDVTHTRRLNVTKNLRKWVMAGDGTRRLEEVGEVTEQRGGHEQLPDDHPIHARESDHSTSLTKASLQDFVDSHDVVLVNFFAPWCHWCNLLEPVWENTAKEAEGKEYHNSVKFAKVDCTANADLCREHLVRAYPTILTWQSGKVDLHNMYRGDRSTQAFLDHVEHLDWVHKRMKDGHFEPPAIANAPGDGSEGCMIEGQLFVKRVPGAIAVSAKSDWHDFEAKHIDLGHTVSHLSFGELSRLAPTLMANTAPLDGAAFDAKLEPGKGGLTHHHYLKIVETTFKFERNEPVGAYQFTAHYHGYKNLKDGAIAQAKFQFDIDPMAVIVTEQRVPLYRFLTSICAVIGGVFTVLGMLNEATLTGVGLAKKLALGKAD